ncbi:MAG: hypothetical protein NXI32_29435 [bacterium]|nr:hypothetical protein [bacterium]
MNRNSEPPVSKAASDGLLFPGFRLWVFKPSDFLPDLDGQFGLSVGRTLAATALLAISLGVMRIIPSVGAGAVVIPLWFSAIGAFLDGFRGAARGAVMAIVYPIYLSLIVALAGLFFWCYALLHSAMLGYDVF